MIFLLKTKTANTASSGVRKHSIIRKIELIGSEVKDIMLMKNSITATIRDKFKDYQKIGNHHDTIIYLSELLERGYPDEMFSGFCLWNISDSFAMLRETDALYKNHIIFYNMLCGMADKYRFWCVCDATQRFTLEIGGHGNFWWDIYMNIVEICPNITEVENIEFETHRASLSVNPKMITPLKNLELARRNFNNFLYKAKESPNIDFYRLIYSSLCLRNFGIQEYDILSLCNTLFSHLSKQEFQSIYVVGEWENLNEQRTNRSKAQVGINSAINSFIDVGERTVGKELYLTALNYGLPVNTYIEKRLAAL